MSARSAARMGLAALLAAMFPASAISASPNTIEVDLGSPAAMPSMLGFLDGVDYFCPICLPTIPLPPPPPLKWAQGVMPAIWRGGPLTVSYALRAGALFDMVTNFPYGINDPGSGGSRWMPGGNGAPPYRDPDQTGLDWSHYVTFLKGLIPGNTQAQYWEFWNEPDQNRSWPQIAGVCSANTSNAEQERHLELLFETYQQFYKTLRATLPGAKLVAPSLSSYCPSLLTRFLDYALRNGLEVDVLSWHELGRDGSAIPSIAQHLQDARSQFLLNPKYAPLKLKEIYVGETVAPSFTYNPGEAIAYLYYLEQGGADRAGRSCQYDTALSGGTPSGCENDSIDSILVPPVVPDQPQLARASWWVYNVYGGMTSQRLACSIVTPAVAEIACLAGFSSPRTAQVLAGNFGTSPAEITIEVNGLSPVTVVPVHVTVSSLTALPQCTDPNTATLACLQGVTPQVLLHDDPPILGTGFSLTLPQIQPHDALIVEVSLP